MEAAAPPLAVPVRRLRATLRAVLRAVEESRERVVLTRHGRPVAALVPVGALDALDLLGRLLPVAADVTAGLPDAGGAGDETSSGPAEIRAPEVSVPSPSPAASPHTRPGARP